jgi:hypothetical protein
MTMLGAMPYLMPYAILKIGVNSIADITNGIYIGIVNSIVRNNSIPSYIVKANAYTGQCIYRPPQLDLEPAQLLFFVNVPSSCMIFRASSAL